MPCRSVLWCDYMQSQQCHSTRSTEPALPEPCIHTLMNANQPARWLCTSMGSGMSDLTSVGGDHQDVLLVAAAMGTELHARPDIAFMHKHATLHRRHAFPHWPVRASASSIFSQEALKHDAEAQGLTVPARRRTCRARLGITWGGWPTRRLGKQACNLKLAQGVKDSQLGCHASKENLAKAELQKFDQLHGAWSQGLIHPFVLLMAVPRDRAPPHTRNIRDQAAKLDGCYGKAPLGYRQAC